MQTRRPCQISRCGNRPQSSRGTSRCRSRSIFTGSSWRVSPSRWDSRRTCVSTTIPCALPSSAATTFAVLRATPGSRTSSSSRRGTSPPNSSISIRIVPRSERRLLAEEAGGEDVPLQLLLRHREVVLRAAGTSRRASLGHAVDVHVGRLRREHHRHEQLERRPEAERDRRVRVLGRQPLDDRADPFAPAPDRPPRLADVATRHAGARRTVEEVERLGARRRLQQVLDEELAAIGRVPVRLLEPFVRRVAVVVELPQLDVGAEDRPVRTECVVREPDAACVDDAPAPDAPVDLEVRVPADDGRLLGRRPASRPRSRPASRSVKTSSSLRGVAWQKSVGPSPSTSSVDRQRQTRREVDLLLRQRRVASVPSRVRRSPLPRMK